MKNTPPHRQRNTSFRRRARSRPPRAPADITRRGSDRRKRSGSGRRKTASLTKQSSGYSVRMWRGCA